MLYFENKSNNYLRIKYLTLIKLLIVARKY